MLSVLFLLLGYAMASMGLANLSYRFHICFEEHKFLFWRLLLVLWFKSLSVPDGANDSVLLACTKMFGQFFNEILTVQRML
uniref:Putative secreted protein n=1 Tax=Ixodes ricinus TaxID=34613 RepID=A0A6B0U833_IXORI